MQDSSASHTPRHSRRRVLKGAVAGVAAGATLSVTTILPSGSVSAHTTTVSTHKTKEASKEEIVNIAVTAERLAITFYTNAIANAAALNLSPATHSYLMAALAEEQLHEQLFAAHGGRPLTSIFSFPDGAATFTNFKLFVQTQQQLEGALSSAYLAAVKELADQNQTRLAQMLAQIAVVEGEHRVLGRVIAGHETANDHAFAPVLIAQVSDTTQLLTRAGYLSPVPGNSYSYIPASTSVTGIDYRTPFTICL